MARIRSIKPEFWQDHRIAADLSRDQRLFYVGLWNDADDEGRFQAHPRRLLGVVFPYDRDLSEKFIEDSLRTLADTGRVVLYTVGGEPYGQLTKFAGHQRINRPSPSRIPAPDSELARITERSVNGHDEIREGSEHGARARELGSGDGARSREQGEQSGAAIAASPVPRKSGKDRAVRLPTDWQPKESHRAKATKNGLDVEHEADKMRHWAAAKGEKCVDWNARFHLWLDNARATGPPNGRPNRKSTRDTTAELLRHRQEIEQVPLNTGSIFDHDR